MIRQGYVRGWVKWSWYRPDPTRAVVWHASTCRFCRSAVEALIGNMPKLARCRGETGEGRLDSWIILNRLLVFWHLLNFADKHVDSNGPTVAHISREKSLNVLERIEASKVFHGCWVTLSPMTGWDTTDGIMCQRFSTDVVLCVFMNYLELIFMTGWSQAMAQSIEQAEAKVGIVQWHSNDQVSIKRAS